MSTQNSDHPTALDIRQFVRDPLSLDARKREQCERLIESDPAAATLLEEEDKLAWRQLFDNAANSSARKHLATPVTSSEQMPAIQNGGGPAPHQMSRRFALGAVIATGVGSWFTTKQVSANSVAELQKERDLLQSQINKLNLSLEELGLRRAVQFEGSPFQIVGRDQLGLAFSFDRRHVKRVEYRWNQTAAFEALFIADQPRPQLESFDHRSLRSEALPLNGDVITAELRVEVYEDVQEHIPETSRVQSRVFALTPLGITADPPALPEKPVDGLTHDGDPREANRYTVRGRLPRDQQSGELPARSYLLIYPLLTDQVWVSDVIMPSADGRFFVKCYLGTAVDNERFLLKVISYYGSTKSARAYKPGDQFDKLTDWQEQGFRVFDGGFKTNNGQNGLDMDN